MNHGDDLKAAPNKAYMMSTPALAGEDPKQVRVINIKELLCRLRTHNQIISLCDNDSAETELLLHDTFGKLTLKPSTFMLIHKIIIIILCNERTKGCLRPD